MKAGAKGITVAKVSEAEVMVEADLNNIFIAIEIYGQQKMERLRQVARKGLVSVSADNREQVLALSEVFAGEANSFPKRLTLN